MSLRKDGRQLNRSKSVKIENEGDRVEVEKSLSVGTSPRLIVTPPARGIKSSSVDVIKMERRERSKSQDNFEINEPREQSRESYWTLRNAFVK